VAAKKLTEGVGVDHLLRPLKLVCSTCSSRLSETSWWTDDDGESGCRDWVAMKLGEKLLPSCVLILSSPRAAVFTYPLTVTCVDCKLWLTIITVTQSRIKERDRCTVAQGTNEHCY